MQVSAGAGLDDIATSAGSKTTGVQATSEEHELEQEEKPRSRIVAEYLASGYKLTDTALNRAIQLDNAHGISSRFTAALTNFDSKYKATDRAKGLDQSYGITDKGTKAWAGLNSYFVKALDTGAGQRLAAFYTQTDKQVRDIHNEAKRLADLKAGKTGGPSSEGGTLSANEKTLQDQGDGKTKCQCKKTPSRGSRMIRPFPHHKLIEHVPPFISPLLTLPGGGDTGVCPCGEGQCA